MPSEHKQLDVDQVPVGLVGLGLAECSALERKRLEIAAKTRIGRAAQE